MSENNQPIIKYYFGDVKETLTLPWKVFSGESVYLKSTDGSRMAALVISPKNESLSIIREFLAKKNNFDIDPSGDQPKIKYHSDDGTPSLALSGDVFSGDVVRLMIRSDSQALALAINPTYENIFLVQEFMAKLLGLKAYSLPKDYLKEIGFIQDTDGNANTEIASPGRESLSSEKEQFYKGRGVAIGYG